MKALVVALSASVALSLTAGVTLTAAVAASTTSAACGPGGPARAVAGHDLDPEQLANTATIVDTTAGRHLPARAAVIAVATALQESSLRNVPYGDRDSLGLFQQRASWGPASTRLDPVASTTLFLDALVAVPAWETLPVTVASDQVQHSAYPWAVAKWETLATALVTDQWAASSAPVGAGGPGGAPVPSSCPGLGGDGMPVDGSLARERLASVPGRPGVAVVFALAQLGKPYLWGGEGPDAYDCSGLTMRAWAAAGVAIGRTTHAQLTSGVPITSTTALRPGDLIFIAGSDGTAAAPGHVGMFVGTDHGVPTLVQAPHTGAVVHLTPLKAWTGLIVAIRRPASTPGA